MANKPPHLIREKYTEDDIRYNDSSYKCSECGRIVDFKENYCPDCGAKMFEPQETEKQVMSDSFEFTLHSPLTKEDWNKISDAEHENTMYVTFQTPQGRQVRYIKCDVLDKIKGYVDHIRNTGMGKKKSLEYIEKLIEGLKAESEPQESEDKE